MTSLTQKPELQTEEIPDELKALKQWVVCNKHKHPKQPNGKAARVNDPTTWSTFERGAAAYDKSDFYGIGYVFSESDPYVGIDFDDCFDSNGKLIPEVQRWVDAFDSYTEISQSGKGIHIIVIGKLPGAGKQNGKKEIYDRLRYFIFTGNVLPGSTSAIEERQDVINRFYEELIRADSQEFDRRQLLSGKDVKEGERNTTLHKALSSIAGRAPKLELPDLITFGNGLNSSWSQPLPESEVINTARSVSKYLNQSPERPLVISSFTDIVKRDIPPRKYLLSPILAEQSLSMVHAWRGVGKTHFSLAIAYAVATGGAFLKWKAPGPKKVLYIDGELPLIDLQTRLTSIAPTPPPEASNLQFINPDEQEKGMPDLSSEEGQEWVNRHISEDTKFIVIDNISCLVRGNGKENDAESWVKVSEWALYHRSQGRSILFVHHSGKSGAQRGTSKREDLLDTVFHLDNPSDYTPAEGALFEVHFQKSRGFYGKDAEPFRVRLTTNVNPDGIPVQEWEMEDIADHLDDVIVELYEKEKWKQIEIAREQGVDPSTISRHIKRLKNEGRITRK